MRFEPTKLHGAFVVAIQRASDARGDFARIWGSDEMAEHGLNPVLAQASLSFNLKAGTLRGMHFQQAPHEEAKLVRCTRGEIFDVIVDLRRDSPTFLEWEGVQLRDDSDLMIYVPEGFAHGFLTLVDDTEVTYYISQFYEPDAQSGLRYDDPAIAIRWPNDIVVVSERDRSWPDFAT